MIWWWLAVELFFIAFFVYGYIIYKRRLKNPSNPTNPTSPKNPPKNAGEK